MVTNGFGRVFLSVYDRFYDCFLLDFEPSMVSDGGIGVRVVCACGSTMLVNLDGFYSKKHGTKKLVVILDSQGGFAGFGLDFQNGVGSDDEVAISSKTSPKEIYFSLFHSTPLFSL